MPIPSETSTPFGIPFARVNYGFKWARVLGLLYLLLISVSMIGGGFKLATGDHAMELFVFANNPVAGLVVGVLTTALLQSSSTVTTVIVGLVAGGLPVAVAIPMVMGANIGTTITNTIVSLGHIRQGDAFRRAFSAATVHDIFNLLSVVIFLPLEIAFGLLEKSAAYLAGVLVGGESVDLKSVNFIKPLVNPVVEWTQAGLSQTVPDNWVGAFMIVLGVLSIILVISSMGKLLKYLMVGKAQNLIQGAVGKGPASGVASGTLITLLVQSSSTTTSLVVPLAGAGVLSLRQVYPFTLGANVGTCITALIAATAVVGDSALLALQIALVHLVYNVLAVAVIFGIPYLRKVPTLAAQALADRTANNKFYGVAYIIITFFVLPTLLIIITAPI